MSEDVKKNSSAPLEDVADGIFDDHGHKLLCTQVDLVDALFEAEDFAAAWLEKHGAVLPPCDCGEIDIDAVKRS